MLALPLAARFGAAAEPSGAVGELRAYQRDRSRWLIVVRWYVIAAAVVALLVTTWLGILLDPVPVWLVLGAAAAANLAFDRVQRAVGDHRIMPLVTAQIVVDLVILSQVLYWGGGSDSPFGIFFLFPMAVAGMLLPLRRAVTLGGLSVVLHGGTLVGEAVGLVPHRSLQLGDHALHDAMDGAALWHSPEYVVAYVLSLAVAEVGIAWFVAILVRRLRETEERRLEHERVARSRERLARIGTLSAGVAHTVRNPLHGVLNCVDMLRERSGGDPETNEVLDLMGEGVARIDRVTRRLLNLANDAPTDRMLTEPAALVEDAVRFTTVAARDRGVTLASDPGTAPPLWLDADRVMEALVNVLENAVQASPDGQEVRVRAWLDPGDPVPHLVVEVEDDGTGIPDGIIDRVFDPFFTTKPSGEGSGLGLAIARHVVDVHQGSLEVRSRPGEGTLVQFSLPYTAGEGR